jgi:hypothetical protein
MSHHLNATVLTTTGGPFLRLHARAAVVATFGRRVRLLLKVVVALLLLGHLGDTIRASRSCRLA